MTALKAMIVGGPNDGMIVDVEGPQRIEPVPVPFRYYGPSEIPSVTEPFTYRVYDLHQWSDRSGVTGGLRYVLRTHRDGLVR